jgi:NADH dehydrogenase
LLTFVVAGGGFAGVETIGSINDFLKGALPYYSNLRPEMVRVVLVHPGDFVLPELGEQLGGYASRKLAERGVEIRSNTKIKAVTSTEVELTDGTRIKSFTLVWTAGAAPHPLLEKLPLPKERQRLKVNTAMGVEGYPGIWALGDCAMIPDEHGGYQPPTAQHASREGKVLAHNIIANTRGEAFPIQYSRFAGIDWPAYRSRSYSRHQLFGVCGLVALAHDLSAQTSQNRKEAARRAGLDLGCLLFQRFCSISPPTIPGRR